MKLYEISAGLESIFDELTQAEGELTPEMEARLDQLEGAFDAKVESIALLIKNKEALNKARAEEIKTLQAFKKADEGAIERLENYLLREMQRLDKPKVETARAKVSIRNTPLKVVAPETQELLENYHTNGHSYIKLKKEYIVDKVALLDAIKKNLSDVPEWAKTETGQKVSIK